MDYFLWCDGRINKMDPPPPPPTACVQCDFYAIATYIKFKAMSWLSRGGGKIKVDQDMLRWVKTTYTKNVCENLYDTRLGQVDTCLARAEW